MGLEENNYQYAVIQGEDAKKILKHLTACFVAVSKHKAIYSDCLLSVQKSYALIHSLMQEEVYE